MHFIFAQAKAPGNRTKKRGRKYRKKRRFALNFYSVVKYLTQFDTILIFGNPAIERGVLLLSFFFGLYLSSHATAIELLPVFVAAVFPANDCAFLVVRFQGVRREVRPIPQPCL